jgi:hypothetical protein
VVLEEEAQEVVGRRTAVSAAGISSKT